VEARIHGKAIERNDLTEQILDVIASEGKIERRASRPTRRCRTLRSNPSTS